MPSRIQSVAALAAVAVLTSPLAVARTRPAVTGFAPAQAGVELSWEQKFLQLPQNDEMRLSEQTLTARPHMAGTPADYATAQYVAAEFKKAGLETEIVPYSALLPYPQEVKVEIVAPGHVLLPNYGTPIPGDPSSYRRDAAVGFNAYSPSGDVTAPVVYANYGLEEDYAELAREHVSVKGKIVLVRYGRSYRGIKSDLAAKAGAVGVLIYSDPNDDGYHAGNVYPNGPWRPAQAIQRGSILNGNYPGAALKPDQQPDATEKAAWQAVLPKLPTAPISYAAAKQILQRLQGKVAPRSWQGGLPLTYHLGDTDDTTLHLQLKMDYQYRTIWDVVGTIPGRSAHEVLIGNHRDAWTFGGIDPNSGTIVLLEAARTLGRLHQQGWTPQRTIRFCSWDAEEFDLIGSTQYALEHLPELQKDAVAYINTDEGDFGPHFSASAVPSLYRVIRNVAKEVPDPHQPGTVYDNWLKDAQQDQQANTTSANVQQPPIGDLGGGSDFEPYLGHVGLASADLSFAGPYGVYHALYDDFHYFITESDPDLNNGVAATRVMGLLMMRLADAPLLPLDVGQYAQTIQTYLHNLQDKTAKQHELNWTPASEAAARLVQAASAFSQRAQKALAAAQGNPAQLQAWNAALAGFERSLFNPQGLPDRPFFKDLIYAPEITRGYATARLPGVSQRIREKNWNDAQQQLGYLADALNRAAARLNAVR